MKDKVGRREPTPQPVRIEYYDEQARTVCIAGTFNRGQAEATPLLRVGRGRWMRLLFLSPGRHEFSFVVNGRDKTRFRR